MSLAICLTFKIIEKSKLVDLSNLLIFDYLFEDK